MKKTKQKKTKNIIKWRHLGIAAISTLLVAGLTLHRGGCVHPLSDDNISVYQYNVAKQDYCDQIVEVGIIPGSDPMSDVPTYVTFKCQTMWLANPQFPNDRFVICSQLEKFWFFIPYEYGKTIIRLPKDFPIPDVGGKIDGKPYVEVVFDLYKKYDHGGAQDEKYEWLPSKPISFFYPSGVQQKMDDYTIFDLRGQHASQRGEIKTKIVNSKFTYIDDVGGYLWVKYDIDHHHELWFEDDYIRVFNNKFDVAYGPGEFGHVAYVRKRDTFGGKVWNFIRFGSYRDLGIYIDNFTSYYPMIDEFHFLCDLCKTADLGYKAGDGNRYDDCYMFSDQFKFNQIEFNDGENKMVFDDLIRWLYADKGIENKERFNVDVCKRVEWKKDDFKASYIGTNYVCNIVLAKSLGEYSMDSETFDFIFEMKNKNCKNGNDNVSLCGSAYNDCFPKWTNEPSEDFLKAFHNFATNAILSRDVVTIGNRQMFPQIDQFGVFSIRKLTDPSIQKYETIGSSRYGRDVTSIILLTEEQKTYKDIGLHNRWIEISGEFETLHRTTYEDCPKLKTLDVNDCMRCYAYKEKKTGYQWIVVAKKDGLTQQTYDRHMFRIRDEKNFFFKNQDSIHDDLEEICRLTVKFRNIETPKDGAYRLYFNASGKVEFYGVLVDFDFTGTEWFNYRDPKSYKLIMD